jgi:hypothetical protein
MEARNDDDLDPPLGDVPEGVGADLYPKHLEYLSRHEAFQEGVLPFSDDVGGRQDVAIDEVAGTEESGDGPNLSRILLRSGAVVLASGAVIAAGIAAVRYRRKRK